MQKDATKSMIAWGNIIACSLLLLSFGSSRSLAQTPPALVDLERVELDANEPGKARLIYSHRVPKGPGPSTVVVPLPPNTYAIPEDLSVVYSGRWQLNLRTRNPTKPNADALDRLRTATKGTIVEVQVAGEEESLRGHVASVDKKQIALRDAENKISVIPLKDLKSVQIEEPAQVVGTTNALVFQLTVPLKGRFEVSFSAGLLRPLRFQHQLRFDPAKTTHLLDTHVVLNNMTTVTWKPTVIVSLRDRKTTNWSGRIHTPVLPGEMVAAQGLASSKIRMTSSFEAQVAAGGKDMIQFRWKLASATMLPAAISGPVSTSSAKGNFRELSPLTIDAKTKKAMLSLGYSSTHDSTIIDAQVGKISSKDHLLAIGGVWLDHCQSHRTNATIVERTGKDRDILFQTGATNAIRVHGSTRNQNQTITVAGGSTTSIPVAVAPQTSTRTDARLLTAARIQQLAAATTVRTIRDKAVQLGDLIDSLEKIAPARSRALATGVTTSDKIFVALDPGVDTKLQQQFDRLQQQLTSIANELPTETAKTNLP